MTIRSILLPDLLVFWPVMSLIDKYIEFGRECNARWYSTDMHNKAVLRLFKSYAKKKNWDLKETTLINAIGGRG